MDLNKFTEKAQEALQEGQLLAVLPFEGGADGADDYFMGGIAESIVGLLAGVSDLIVVSRESTMMFRGKSVDLKAVGRQLSVRYILAGSADRNGERLRNDDQRRAKYQGELQRAGSHQAHRRRGTLSAHQEGSLHCLRRV